MPDPYLTLLRLPGTRRFVVAGLIARIPMSTVNISLILMVQMQYGKWEIAGRVAAVGVLVWALQTIPSARYIDRKGQRAMVPFVIALVSGLVLVIATSQLRGPEWLLWIGVALASVSGPVGSLTRARWSHLLGDDRDKVHTAFALEAALDEVLFVTGPALVTVLAYSVHPASGLILAAIGGGGGTLWLISQRATEPGFHGDDAGRGMGLKVPASVVATAFVGASLGLLFGAIDVTSVAFAKDVGHEAWGGVIIGIISLGSFFGGLAYGARKWRAGLPARLVATSAALALGMFAVSLMPNLVLFAIAGLVAGLAIGPSLTTQNSVVQRIVPQSQLTEGLAWIGIGMGAGVAAGGWLAGRLIDTDGHSGGQVVLAVAAAGIAAVSVAAFFWVRRDLDRLEAAPKVNA